MKADPVNEAGPESLERLKRGLEAELDELMTRRSELNLQQTRLMARLRWICKMLGISVPQPRARKILGKIAVIERLLKESQGPMTLESVCRELEVVGGKQAKLKREAVQSFLHAHPRVFIQHGPNMWDLRSKHVAPAAWTDSGKP